MSQDSREKFGVKTLDQHWRGRAVGEGERRKEKTEKVY